MRHVPWWLRLGLRFGGKATVMGWILILVVAVVTGMVAPKLQWSSPEYEAMATGEVIAVEREGKHWEVTARFVDEWGWERTTTSETEHAPPKVGDQVDVEHGHFDARIRDMSDGGVPWWVLPMLVPLLAAGAFLAIRGGRTGARAEHLLRDGVLTHGTLVETRSGWISINRSSERVFTFEFTLPGGARERCTARTFGKELEDQAAEPLLYDPAHPSDATMLDHLPGRPTLVEDGIRASSWSAVAAIVPVAAVIASVVAIARLVA